MRYIELGRVWLLLIACMVFWLWLMYRAFKPALKKEKSYWQVTFSSTARLPFPVLLVEA